MSKYIQFYTPTEIKDLHEILKNETDWGDGLYSSIPQADKVNTELRNPELYQEIVQKIMGTIEFGQYTLVKAIEGLIVNKYTKDGHFQPHYDGIQGQQYNFTIFVNDDYEGGDLIIEGKTIKPKPGWGYLYKSTDFHQVTDITSGTRYGIVGWVESRIKDDEIRELYQLLNYAATDIMKEKGTSDKNYLRLMKSTAIIGKKFYEPGY